MLAKIAFSFFLFIHIAHTHEGPPYPILVDYQISSKATLSIWADPDVGLGTFDFYLKTSGPLLPQDFEFAIVSQLPNEPMHRLNSKAVYKEMKNDYAHYVAEIPYDKEAEWSLQFTLQKRETSPIQVIGKGEIMVEVTPPGPTKNEFYLYLFPFIAIAAIWFKTLFKKRA